MKTEIEKTTEAIQSQKVTLENKLMVTMAEWKEATEGAESFRSDTVVYRDGYNNYYLWTGHDEIMTVDCCDVSTTCNWWTKLTCSDMRYAIKAITKCKLEILEKLKEEEEENRKTIETQI